MKQYKDIVKYVLDSGQPTPNRTGEPTISVFGYQSRYLMDQGFPILTTRYQPFEKIVAETLWYLKGSSSCKYLDDHNVKVWKLWTDPDTNTVGPIYPIQLRHWDTSTKYSVKYTEQDQLLNVIKSLRNNPYSRRHIISYWNVKDLPDESLLPIENVKRNKMSLAPCGVLYQFNITKSTLHYALKHPKNQDVVKQMLHDSDTTSIEELHDYIRTVNSDFTDDYPLLTYNLSMQVYQRSWDVGAAGGWNISQYALILHILSLLTDTLPYELVHTVGNMHIYHNQIKVLSDQLLRKPYPLPTIQVQYTPDTTYDTVISDLDNLDKYIDISLQGYQYHPALKIPVSM